MHTSGLQSNRFDSSHKSFEYKLHEQTIKQGTTTPVNSEKQKILTNGYGELLQRSDQLNATLALRQIYFALPHLFPAKVPHHRVGKRGPP